MVAYFTLHGEYNTLAGDPDEGYTQIRLDNVPGQVLRDLDGNKIFNGAMKCEFDDAGEFTVQLPCDDGTVVPTGFAFRIDSRPRSGGRKTDTLVTPSVPGTVEVSSLDDGAVSIPTDAPNNDTAVAGAITQPATSAALKSSTTATVGNAKVIYVTTSGSNSNNGLTWGNAKATIAAALTAAGATGTVMLGDGDHHITATINQDVLNSIVGQGSLRTRILVDFDGVGIDWKPQTAFSGNPGGVLSGLTIVAGTGASSNACGVRIGAITKPHLFDVRADAFTGTSGIGFWFRNVAISGTPYWTERIDARACVFNNCTVGVCFDVSGGTTSFLYAENLGFTGNVQAVAAGSPAQTGLLIRNAATLTGCNINWVVNVAGVNGANTVAPTLLKLTGTNSNILGSLINIRGEMTSGTAATSVEIGTGAYIQGSGGVLYFSEGAGFTPSIVGDLSFSGSVKGLGLGVDVAGGNKQHYATATRAVGGPGGFAFQRPTPSTTSPSFGLVSHPNAIDGRSFADTDFVLLSHDGAAQKEFIRARYLNSGEQLVEFAANLATRRLITSGALTTRTFTSGTAAQMAGRGDRQVYLPVTFSPTAGAAATLLLELSPDNTTFSTLGTWTKPANSTTGIIDVLPFHVPHGWWVRVTATNATLGTATYY